MDSSQIDRVLSGNRLTSKSYMGCFPSDKIPACRHFPCSMVVNFDDSTKDGSHWVALYAPNKFQVYYFDSYGTEGVPNLRETLSKRFLWVTRQNLTHQNISSTVCGQYAIFFIYMCSKGMPYNNIDRTLRRQSNPDKYVADYVNKYILPSFL